MELSTALSKTEQVTNFLREGIESMSLRPGDKILSSRNLAANFSTSKQVIESAFNILEDEGLIIRKARKGAFVNKASALSHLKEVYILGIGVTANDPYFSQIMKITYPPILKDDFSFISRTYSAKSSIGSILDIEINRINNMPGLDCVLVNASPLVREDVKSCLKIKRPVIFLGDFSKGEIVDLEFNQITGDNAYLAEQHLDYMIGMGHREITVFCGSLKHLFNKQYAEGAYRKANEKNIKVHIVEFPKGMSFLPSQKRDETIREILANAIADKSLVPAIIAAGNLQDPIKKELGILDAGLAGRLTFIPEIPLDYTQLYVSIFRRIEEAITFPDKYYRTRLKLQLKFK